MLSKKQIEEVREHLERSQNPVFMYDNDADGLCSFLLLRRYLGRGKGMAIRTHPDIDLGYVAKIKSFGSDAVFVLDKPILGENFTKAINDLGIPLIWIDHHDLGLKYDNVFSYNPCNNKNKSTEPVTAVCFEIANRKEDIWIALMGCLSDHYLPDFSFDFSKKYPDLWKKTKEPFDAYYNSEIGKLAHALAFCLKDSLTHVNALQDFLIKCNSPSEFMNELKAESTFGVTFRNLKKKYDSLVERAECEKKENVIFFEYGGETSMSADVANELSFRNPGKVVAVAYVKEGFCTISLRGKNVKKFADEILSKLENSRGGGHENAVGVRIQRSDLERFKEALREKFI